MAKLDFPDRDQSPWTNPDNGITYVWKGGTQGAWHIASAGDTDIFVAKTGDKMTGDLTLGPDGDTNITLDATDGSASFAGNITCSGTESQFGTSADYNSIGIGRPTNGNPSGRIGYFPIFTVPGDLSTSRYGLWNNSSNDNHINLGVKGSGSVIIQQITDNETPSTPTIYLNADGSAEFAGRIKALSGIIAIQSESATSKIDLGASGFANFGRKGDAGYGEVRINSSNKAIQVSGPDNRVVWTLDYTGNIGSRNAILELEPDNDDYYTTTTDVDEEGNTVENRVYNGPTLDVKERLTKADNALIALKSAAAAATDFAELKAAITTALANI